MPLIRGNLRWQPLASEGIMKQNKSTKYAYLAGVIDSDGCIAIKRTKPTAKSKRKTISYSLQVLINQVDGRMLNYIRGAFGGCTTVCRNQGQKHQDVYRWYVTGDKAAYILKRLIPFLRAKKEQAQIGLRLQNRITKGCGKPETGWRTKKVTEEELAIREHLYISIKQEKQKIIPLAAVETKRGKSSLEKISDSPFHSEEEVMG